MIEILHFTSQILAVDSGGGISSLGVDIKALTLQVITFVVLFLLLKKFAFGKIIATLEARRKTIDDGVRLGQEMIAEKAKLEEEITQILRTAHQEADKVIATSHVEANQIIKDAEAQAIQRMETILAEAHDRIDDDIARARASLKNEMLALVSEATEVIIQEKLDATKDAKLIERALKQEHVV